VIDPDVRAAERTDVDALAELEIEARSAVADQRGGGRWLEEHPPVSDWHDRIDAGEVLVAHIDDVVVGYLIWIVGPDRIVRIDQVWVTPEARELGFGDALLEAAVQAARQEGAVAVEGQSLPGDRHTKNLYERAGIVARLITTYKAFEN
jgi:GNAT superfamily N-acetyltransferase